MDTSPSRMRRVTTIAVWLLAAAICFPLFIASVPAYYAMLTTVCGGEDSCNLVQLDAQGVRSLEELGLSIPAYALVIIALHVLIVVVALVMSGIIIRRQAGERMALVTAIVFTTFPPSEVIVGLVDVYPEWRPVVLVVHLLSRWSLPFFFYLFPSGHFVPSWTRWLAALWCLLLLPIYFYPGWSFTESNYPPLLTAVVDTVFISSWVYAPLYRYRRVANRVERQQTKWVVFGMLIGVVAVVVYWLPILVDPSVGRFGSLYSAMKPALYSLWALVLIVAIGVAMLRYRLWDIDPIINRALVYGALTAILALVYFCSVVALQQLFRGLTGQSSSLAVVASTLTIAALFQPLRRRIQATIDQRFYRRKYDAAQTLAAFSAKLRDDVDLDLLLADLVAAVDDTVRPAHVSVWLRPRKGDEGARSTHTLLDRSATRD